MGNVAADTVGEVSYVIRPAKFKLETPVVYGTGIYVSGTYSDFRDRTDAYYKVFGILCIPVKSKGEPVAEETSVETDVNLL